MALFFLFLPSIAFTLEIKYPTLSVGGKEFTITEGAELQDLILFLYYLALASGGILALAMLIFGGVRYFTSFGNPTVMKGALGQIFSALSGLLILLSSWLILNTISPELLTLKPLKELGLRPVGLPAIALPDITKGIIAHTSLKDPEAVVIRSSIPDLAEYLFDGEKIGLKGKIEKIEFRGEEKYGIILHKNTYYNQGNPGEAWLMTESGDVPDKNFSSITAFIMPSQSFYENGEGIRIYNRPYPERLKEPDCCPKCFWPWIQAKCTKKAFIPGDQIIKGVPDIKKYEVEKGKIANFYPQSFEFLGKKALNYMAIFWENTNYNGVGHVFFGKHCDDLKKADFGWNNPLPKSLKLIQVNLLLPGY